MEAHDQEISSNPELLEEVIGQMGATLGSFGCAEVTKVQYGESYITLFVVETSPLWAELAEKAVQVGFNCKSFVGRKLVVDPDTFETSFPWYLQFRGASPDRLCEEVTRTFIRARALSGTHTPRDLPNVDVSVANTRPKPVAPVRDHVDDSEYIRRHFIGFAVAKAPDGGPSVGKVALPWDRSRDPFSRQSYAGNPELDKSGLGWARGPGSAPVGGMGREISPERELNR